MEAEEEDEGRGNLPPLCHLHGLPRDSQGMWLTATELLARHGEAKPARGHAQQLCRGEGQSHSPLF